jgi:hypothetical protein
MATIARHIVRAAATRPWRRAACRLKDRKPCPSSWVPQTELIGSYTDTLLPKKITINLEFFSDLSLLSRTMTAVLVAHTRGGEQ